MKGPMVKSGRPMGAVKRTPLPYKEYMVVPPEEQVYRFIVAYKQTHDGNSPTMREIMNNCNISSTSMAFFYLEKLVGLGLIRRPEPEFGKRSAANIEVIGGKWEFMGGSHGAE